VPIILTPVRLFDCYTYCIASTSSIFFYTVKQLLLPVKPIEEFLLFFGKFEMQKIFVFAVGGSGVRIEHEFEIILELLSVAGCAFPSRTVGIGAAGERDKE